MGRVFAYLLGAPASCRPGGVSGCTRPSANHNRLPQGVGDSRLAAGGAFDFGYLLQGVR
jgi:hypothetical protein